MLSHTKAAPEVKTNAADVNSKAIDLVMSFVNNMGTDPSEEKKRKKIHSQKQFQQTVVLSSTDDNDDLINSTYANGHSLFSRSSSGFRTIRERNRLSDYLQEQLPSKALLLDNGSAQLDAMKLGKNRSKRNREQSFQIISNRDLLNIHSETNTRKRRKMWQSALTKFNFSFDTISSIHDQWLIYVHRAFFSKGIDEQTLLARFYNGLELVGAKVQLFHNTTYSQSMYKSCCKGPSKKSGNILWTNGLFGYVLEVTSTCYYIYISASSIATEDSEICKIGQVLCIHKVSSNIAVILPNEKSIIDAKMRITAKQTQRSNVDNFVKIDDGFDECDDGNLEQEAILLLEADNNVDISVIDDVTNDTSGGDAEAIDPKQRVLVIFGAYFENNERVRRKEFPYVLPSSSNAL